jgi:uncharacterized membrane protein YeaQ/YmgE (transglycosylase-associated protein family)
MLHLIWYIIVGLIAGAVAKDVMHMHIPLLWTIVLGIVGSVVGGLVTHTFSRPREGAPFHPQGLSFPYLALYLCCFFGTILSFTFLLDRRASSQGHGGQACHIIPASMTLPIMP